jgi:RNA-directed DNA polymerase
MVAQMAVVLILEPISEADFLDCSHGFRRGRKAYDALEEIRTNLKAGRTAVYDADLEGCFDTISHDKLMATGVTTSILAIRAKRSGNWVTIRASEW